MRRIGRRLGAILCFCSLTAIPAASFAEEQGDLYDCGKPVCEDWAPKGENTCRVCTIAQCRKQDGEELLVGNKKQTQCYEGHGAPPEDES